MTERVWRVSADVACVRSPDGGRVAALHLEQDVPFILVGTAASVWNSLDGTRTETELIEELARDYGTDASAINADVKGLIHSLSTSGLITSSPHDRVAS
ncbi:pyrroloquinoline quinone biosynthesis protein D [Arthrobacter ginsengisoli]|uniref:Pyrroloquinoline quinone biosynthesis protein D n=1 Tax=Arthrobacter ginsengisoli TaxID=1356565 RepID=A0ABU1UD77_9MICC|nr:PqqD family protein [Arthrobacter ginsengisoli]MDR7083158.1 pyrroloquinoline quinone biosynthesis protein D [Arthrobacter ginsengisoli]